MAKVFVDTMTKVFLIECNGEIDREREREQERDRVACVA